MVTSYACTPCSRILLQRLFLCGLLIGCTHWRWKFDACSHTIKHHSKLLEARKFVTQLSSCFEADESFQRNKKIARKRKSMPKCDWRIMCLSLSYAFRLYRPSSQLFNRIRFFFVLLYAFILKVQFSECLFVSFTTTCTCTQLCMRVCMCLFVEKFQFLSC